MAGSPFRIDRTPTRITVKLFGTLVEQDAQAFGDALTRAIGAYDQPVELVVDMRELQDCRILARGILADTHARLRSKPPM